jgi:hypothetical protein
MTDFWIFFFAIQLTGMLCSAGVEAVHEEHVRFVCHVAALVVLEPGLILARAIIDKFYWERFSIVELFRYSSVFGFFLNAVLAIWARAFFKALRPQHGN